MNTTITAKFKSKDEHVFCKIIELLKTDYRVLAVSKNLFDYKTQEFFVFVNLEEKQ